MAILTVSEVVSAAQRSFADLQTSRGTELANLVHQEILQNLPEARRTVLQITPVSGQQEYPLDYGVFQVGHVEYVAADGTVVAVSGVTVESLDHQGNLNWRNLPGVPSYEGEVEPYGPFWYASSSFVSPGPLTTVIGFFPKPGFATGTFNLYQSELEENALTSGSLCLATLSNSDVYVQGVRYFAALDLYPALAAPYKSEYDRQMMIQANFIRGRQGDARAMSTEDLNPRNQMGYSSLK